MPRAAVRLPARDIGPPYLARFSGVSGTGPLVVRVVVTLALVPLTSAEVVVEDVVTLEVVSLVDGTGLIVAPVAAVALPVGAGELVDVVPWAKAALDSAMVAAALARARCLRVMASGLLSFPNWPHPARP